MKRKTFWMIAVSYTAVVFLLNNVLKTAAGEFLMQLSYVALAFTIVWWIFQMIKFAVKHWMYTRRRKND